MKNEQIGSNEKINFFDNKDLACFGVAGNFTGHLEQAGEAKDFASFRVTSPDAPKALFPTFIPGKDSSIPEFLNVFPFSSSEIRFPAEKDFFQNQKIQIECECGIIFNAAWSGEKIISLKPLYFAASNDISIRREGAKKISEKKNWGPSSKGFSKDLIAIDSFAPGGILDSFRIAGFLIRQGKAYAYGEDSGVSSYSYIYEKLICWLIDRFNNQEDTGPAENINLYLNKSGRPERIFVSIGATRYTYFGQNNFVQPGDSSAVILYPGNKYSFAQIEEYIQARAQGKVCQLEGCSLLWQTVC